MPTRCHPIATLHYSVSNYSFNEHLQTEHVKREIWDLGEFFKWLEEKIDNNARFEKSNCKNGFFVVPYKVTWIDWAAPEGEEWHEKLISHFCEARWLAEKAYANEDKTKVFHNF